MDGYYREAVSSITASLEQFYEFYLQVAARKKGVASEQFDLAWKEMKNQSERQLGAFIATRLFMTATSPFILSKRTVEFKNSVVHKGHISSRDEAVDYAKAVLD